MGCQMQLVQATWDYIVLLSRTLVRTIEVFISWSKGSGKITCKWNIYYKSLLHVFLIQVPRFHGKGSFIYLFLIWNMERALGVIHNIIHLYVSINKIKIKNYIRYMNQLALHFGGRTLYLIVSLRYEYYMSFPLICSCDSLALNWVQAWKPTLRAWKSSWWVFCSPYTDFQLHLPKWSHKWYILIID